MTDDGDVRFVRVTADPTHAAAPWWTASRAAKPDPDSAYRLVAPESHRTFIVMPSRAVAFRAWASGIAGWREDLFTFEEVGLEEVVRVLRVLKMKPRCRLN